MGFFLFQIKLKQYYKVGVEQFILFIDSFVFAHSKYFNFLIDLKLKTLERSCIFLLLSYKIIIKQY